MEKVWEIKDPDSYVSNKKTVIRKGPPPAAEKDPAKAYSLSMFYWGGGQLYNDQLVKGTLFLVAMALLLAGAALGVFYAPEIVRSLRDRRISLSEAFLALELVLFLVILFWVYNAADAYHHARKARKTPFRGVRSRITPVLASLAAPGWGQFLNGQPLKGSFFASLSVISLFSVLSVVITFLAWPLLDSSEMRFVVEGVSAVGLLLLPFAPLAWAFSAYDALKVSHDDLKKEPFWERVKAAYYRGRTQGWVRGVFPQVKSTFLLVLFLILGVIVIYFWSPTEFYTELLAGVKRRLTERGMTIIPALIDQALAQLANR